MNDESREVWGWSTQINIHNCNPEKIRSIEGTYNFLLDLCKKIRMTPYGSPQVIKFGKDEKVAGISANLFLEESNICMHLVDQTNRAFIDIFSCCKYSSKEAFNYCVSYFESTSENNYFDICIRK
jgi:S-adenosylmethionine/arginine decarboxylase-like enzyme